MSRFIFIEINVFFKNEIQEFENKVVIEKWIYKIDKARNDQRKWNDKGHWNSSTLENESSKNIAYQKKFVDFQNQCLF